MVVKQVTRTFSFYTVTIKNNEGTELEKKVLTSKPNEKKIAIDFIKRTGNTNFFITVDEREETRGMSVETFMQHSAPVVKEEAEATESVGE